MCLVSGRRRGRRGRRGRRKYLASEIKAENYKKAETEAEEMLNIMEKSIVEEKGLFQKLGRN